MEGAITWQAVAFFIGLLLPIGGTMFGVWAYIDRQIKTAAAAGAARTEAFATVMTGRIETLEKDISEYKLHVSEKFIKAGDLEKMERRLMDTEARTLAALEQLSKRIDSLISVINDGERRSPRSRQA
jgi:hypothetical protein